MLRSALFAEFERVHLGPPKIHPAKLTRLEMMLSKLGIAPAEASRVSVNFAPDKFKN